MTNTTGARNPAQEASAIVGADWHAHVIEPSPPAVRDDEWFADDPLAVVDGPALVPAGMSRAGSSDWSTWVKEHPEHAEWVADHWLGGERQLPSPPSDLVETRLALHRLAAYVIAPARHRATGKFGLRWTYGGFGTPFFGDDRQIRVQGTELIDQRADTVRTAPITTLQAAAEFLDTPIDTETAAEHDSPPVGETDAPLAVDRVASDFLGAWYGMGFAALEQVRDDDASVDASRPQLWPGHFDPAIEIGDEDHRGSYGASPGDPAIPEPYLYVSVWWPDRVRIDRDNPAWNAPSFVGSILKLSDFGPDDPVATAAQFFGSIRDLIAR